MERKREFLRKKGQIIPFPYFFSIRIFPVGLTDTEINYAFQLIPQQGRILNFRLIKTNYFIFLHRNNKRNYF